MDEKKISFDAEVNDDKLNFRFSTNFLFLEDVHVYALDATAPVEFTSVYEAYKMKMPKYLSARLQGTFSKKPSQHMQNGITYQLLFQTNSELLAWKTLTFANTKFKPENLVDLGAFPDEDVASDPSSLTLDTNVLDAEPADDAELPHYDEASFELFIENEDPTSDDAKIHEVLFESEDPKSTQEKEEVPCFKRRRVSQTRRLPVGAKQFVTELEMSCYTRDSETYLRSAPSTLGDDIKGAFANENFSAGSFVGLYTGYWSNASTFHAKHGDAMVDRALSTSAGVVIDATEDKCVCSFINHFRVVDVLFHGIPQCHPNVKFIELFDELTKQFVGVGLFTTIGVKEGDELFVHYGFSPSGPASDYFPGMRIPAWDEISDALFRYFSLEYGFDKRLVRRDVLLSPRVCMLWEIVMRRDRGFLLNNHKEGYSRITSNLTKKHKKGNGIFTRITRGQWVLNKNYKALQPLNCGQKQRPSNVQATSTPARQ